MKSAYNSQWLHNLLMVKEARQWMKHNLIDGQTFNAIQSEYTAGFYHPNFIIRILLFIATLIALSGVTGLLALMFADGGQEVISVLCLLYGLGSFLILDRIFIGNLNHYKSGVNEAILYHSIGFSIGGIAGLTDFNAHVVILACLLVFSFAAYRYLDLISTAGGLASLAYLIFYELYEAGGLFQQLIPIFFIIIFTPFYFLVRKVKNTTSSHPWESCLILLEALCLILVYAAGNYLVVRELSISLMDLYLEEGQEIPFAFLFYGLTVIVPVLYLYAGIKLKDFVLLRVSLVAIAFSVFTFKYYYSLGHHEITFTVGGIILLAVSIALFRYLKVPQGGYTREELLKDKWSNVNAEAFIVSQTLGGNKVVVEERTHGGGGGFGGGGSSDSF